MLHFLGTPCIYTNMYLHVPTYKHVHTCINQHVPRRYYLYKQTCVHLHVPTCTCDVQTSMCTNIQTCVHLHTKLHPCAHLHVPTCTCSIQTSMCTNIQRCAHLHVMRQKKGSEGKEVAMLFVLYAHLHIMFRTSIL